jgi:hypothetical protein
MGACYKVGINIIPLGNIKARPGTIFDLLSKAHDTKERILLESRFYNCDLRMDVLLETVSVLTNNKKQYKKLIDVGEQETEKYIYRLKKHV